MTLRVSSVFAMSHSDLKDILVAVNGKIREAERQLQVELAKAFHGLELDDMFERVNDLKQLRDSICEQLGEMKVEKKLGKILAQDKMRVEVNAEKQEMTVYLVFADDDTTKVCLNKDSIFLALTSAIASLTGFDKNSMIIEYNGCLIDSFELVFEHGIVDGDFLKVVFHHMAEYQSHLEQFAHTQTTPFVGLNVADATHPHPCQITMKTVYGDITFVYHYADGQTVGDVETALAVYFKDYLPDNVNFKDCYALRLPKSILAFWEPLRPFGDQFGHVKFLLACRLSGGGKRAKKQDGVDNAKTPKDIKQILNDNIVQLKAMQNPSASIGDVLGEIEKIVADVGANPSTPVSSLFEAIPVSKRATILASAMSISTRPEERIEFITEQVLGEKLEKLDNLARMTLLAKKTLCQSIQYAIHTEYQDNKGDIGWQKMMKDLADKMSSQSSTDTNSGCIAM